jgi:hypothetical protein
MRFCFYSLRLAAGKESGQWSDTIPANIKEFFRNGCSRMSITDSTKIFRISFYASQIQILYYAQNSGI